MFYNILHTLQPAICFGNMTCSSRASSLQKNNAHVNYDISNQRGVNYELREIGFFLRKEIRINNQMGPRKIKH